MNLHELADAVEISNMEQEAGAEIVEILQHYTRLSMEPWEGGDRLILPKVKKEGES